MSTLLLTTLVALMIILAVLYAVKRPAIAQTPRSALEVLKSRPAWKPLPSEFLNTLANRLDSVERASEFVQLCEGTGMLKNNIIGGVELAHGDTEDAIDGVAITLTSYANAMGKQKQYSQAKRVLELALLLRPRHVPAWESMAITDFAMGDCKAAVSWADKVLSFKPDPNSKDYYESGLAIYMTMTEEEQKRLARDLGLPDGGWNWNQSQEIMKAIKDACSK